MRWQRTYKSWAYTLYGVGAMLYMGEVEQLGQPAEEEISEVAGSNPALTLILSKSCVPTQGVSRKPLTAEGKSAADAYICHMYVLLAYQEHMP